MAYSPALYAQPPVASSEELGWRGLRVERYQLAAAELPAHHHADHLLLLYQAPVAVRRQHGHRAQTTSCRPGDLGLYPGGDYGPIAWNAPIDNVHVSLAPTYLEELSQQQLGSRPLRDHLRFADPLLSALVRQLLGTTGARRGLGRLYVEALAAALGCHLLEHYAAGPAAQPPPGRRLPAATLARLDAYLEAHADTAVSLATLAGLANLSVHHFARLFRLTTGQAPYQYVLGWKIRQAKHLLRAGALPIGAIGDALGFASPAHFAGTFRRVVGLSPRAFQQQK